MLVEQQALIWYITAVYEHPLLMKQENVGINSSLSRMPALVRESVNSLQPAINLVSFWSWSKTKRTPYQLDQHSGRQHKNELFAQ